MKIETLYEIGDNLYILEENQITKWTVFSINIIEDMIYYRFRLLSGFTGHRVEYSYIERPEELCSETLDGLLNKIKQYYLEKTKKYENRD